MYFRFSIPLIAHQNLLEVFIKIPNSYVILPNSQIKINVYGVQESVLCLKIQPAQHLPTGHSIKQLLLWAQTESAKRVLLDLSHSDFFLSEPRILLIWPLPTSPWPSYTLTFFSRFNQLGTFQVPIPIKNVVFFIISFTSFWSFHSSMNMVPCITQREEYSFLNHRH